MDSPVLGRRRAADRVGVTRHLLLAVRALSAALVPAQQVQTHLFDRHDRERSQRLMAALDAINTQWGPGTIRYAAVRVQPHWRMRCGHRSPRYTTRWDELVLVHCDG